MVGAGDWLGTPSVVTSTFVILGLLRGTIEHQYTLHAAGEHVEVDITNGVALVFGDFAVEDGCDRTRLRGVRNTGC